MNLRIEAKLFFLISLRHGKSIAKYKKIYVGEKATRPSLMCIKKILRLMKTREMISNPLKIMCISVIQQINELARVCQSPFCRSHRFSPLAAPFLCPLFLSSHLLPSSLPSSLYLPSTRAYIHKYVLCIK